MIETETKGKQALLDAMIAHVDPTLYDGENEFRCLLGQTARKVLTEDEWSQAFDDIDAIAVHFQVDVALVEDIYDRVAEDHLRNDYEASLAYARHVLTNGGV